MKKPLTILLIDNYDSFTYILYDYFLQLGADCAVIRNDELPFDEVLKLNFDALVLSPGPKKPEDAGLMPEIIAYFHNKKPILGICLGHQGIGEFFGAKLTKAKLPVHGKTSTLYHQNHDLFKGLPDHFEVMRYHSLLLKNIENTDFEEIASTSTGEVMAMVHKKLPIIGVQFHPESILTEHGLQMLKNWLETI
jgi:anthranilate synthase/aminodeoxychorismate synthase-like glutamine amidotransferase